MTSPLWSRLQQQLQESLSSEEFRTWFRPLKVRSEEPDRLVLQAPDKRFLIKHGTNNLKED